MKYLGTDKADRCFEIDLWTIIPNNVVMGRYEWDQTVQDEERLAKNRKQNLPYY
jgi:hypothetical protein